MFNHAGWSSKLLDENIKNFIISNDFNQKILIIDHKLLIKLTWNDINFEIKEIAKRISPRGDGIYEHSAPKVISSMKNLSYEPNKGQVVKFGGHTHGVPKKAFRTVISPGFIQYKYYKNKDDKADENSIYLLISGTVDGSIQLGIEAIPYHPSYLKLTIDEDENHFVSGFCKYGRNDPFVETEIPIFLANLPIEYNIYYYL